MKIVSLLMSIDLLSKKPLQAFKQKKMTWIETPLPQNVTKVILIELINSSKTINLLY